MRNFIHVSINFIVIKILNVTLSVESVEPVGLMHVVHVTMTTLTG